MDWILLQLKIQIFSQNIYEIPNYLDIDELCELRDSQEHTFQ